MGYEPRIKALLWHQGESDCGSTRYFEDLEHLVGNFRAEFEDYADDQDGDQIAFIDALIYDAPESLANFSYGSGVDTLNDQKVAFSEESEMNFYLDTSFKTPNGMKLEIGGNRDGGNYGGCYGIYHYTTKDCYRLGEAYANLIVENDLI
ncbi:MAG: sialate O-acetylesterase [Erysipelotrichia bacterium]|nr:sialate O-acetylesterase [Erysipelotrichia bacterium]